MPVRPLTGVGLPNTRRHPYWLAVLVFVVLCAVNAALQPRFLEARVAASNLTTFLPQILVALAQTYVVLGGSIDLSVGATVSLVNVVVVKTMESLGEGNPWTVAAGLASGLGTGLLAGTLNGFLVGTLRLQPLIATFGTSIVFGGVALTITPQAGGSVPVAYYETYGGDVLGLPFALWVLAAVLAAAGLLARTRFYGYLLATGGNRQAAFQSGLPVTGVRFGSHALAGLLVGVATLCVLGETASADPLMGQAFTLSSVSAVVLGGTSLAGGAGSIFGSVLGGANLGLINTVIFFAKLPYVYQSLLQGVIILVALAGGVLVSRRAHR